MSYEQKLINDADHSHSGCMGRNFMWYQGLNKPSITPPQWVFPVVWTILYIMMAISLFLYLKAT